ncbi:MAG: hypothetical protein GY811_01055 [Myxococcales bacterium]|nr:hypothetical protein [Myxococcales bacterium]
MKTGANSFGTSLLDDNLVVRDELLVLTIDACAEKDPNHHKGNVDEGEALGV